jgi:Uri superfamily endonuclease
MKGCYSLIIKLNEDATIAVGKKNKYSFMKGYYVYVGSALNGLEQRIQRHLRENKKKFWHIDYFLSYAKIVEIYYKENSYREECSIANQLQQNFESIKGFGCSDCRCSSHLFIVKYPQIYQVIKHLDMKQFCTENY